MIRWDRCSASVGALVGLLLLAVPGAASAQWRPERAEAPSWTVALSQPVETPAELLPERQVTPVCRRALVIGLLSGVVVGATAIYVDERANDDPIGSSGGDYFVAGMLFGGVGMAVAGVLYC